MCCRNGHLMNSKKSRMLKKKCSIVHTYLLLTLTRLLPILSVAMYISQCHLLVAYFSCETYTQGLSNDSRPRLDHHGINLEHTRPGKSNCSLPAFVAKPGIDAWD